MLEAITHILIWAHLMSPVSEPMVLEPKLIESSPMNAHTVAHAAAEQNACLLTNSGVVQDSMVSNAPKMSSGQKIVEASSQVPEKTDKDLVVPFSKRLKKCLIEVNDAWPTHAWSERYKYIVVRMQKTAEENYDDLFESIKECLSCIALQTNDESSRAIYSELEICKRELIASKFLAHFQKKQLMIARK